VTSPTAIHTLSLHDALPICNCRAFLMITSATVLIHSMVTTPRLKERRRGERPLLAKRSFAPMSRRARSRPCARRTARRVVAGRRAAGRCPSSTSSARSRNDAPATPASVRHWGAVGADLHVEVHAPGLLFRDTASTRRAYPAAIPESWTRVRERVECRARRQRYGLIVTDNH